MPADAIVETVPQLRRRYGDHVVQGSNNTAIILGTDRAKKGPASVDDGLGHVKADGKGKGTGTIHIVAGRQAADPDLSKDDAFIYITRKSKVDDNLDLGSVESADNDKPAAIVKSDLIRIVGRKSIKVCANDDQKHYLFMSGDKIKISFGDSATLEIVDKKITVTMGSNEIQMDDSKGHVNVKDSKISWDGSKVTIDAKTLILTGGCEKPMKTLLSDLTTFYQDYASHMHPSAMGPTGPPTPPSQGAITGGTDNPNWNT